MNWTVVKADYLKKSKTREAILSWVHFLRKLGVKIGIAVQQVNVNIPEVGFFSITIFISVFKKLSKSCLSQNVVTVQCIKVEIIVSWYSDISVMIIKFYVCQYVYIFIESVDSISIDIRDYVGMARIRPFI